MAVVGRMSAECRTFLPFASDNAISVAALEDVTYAVSIQTMSSPLWIVYHVVDAMPDHSPTDQIVAIETVVPSTMMSVKKPTMIVMLT